MIDHVLGRPSTQFRKIQVFAVLLFWSLYILRGNKHGPPVFRQISSRLYGRMTPWQATVMTMLSLYVSRNFAKLVGLECPEPLANLYSRSYFRATWVTTALDAGFWTAMNIKRKWLRDLASMVFSFYYLLAAEQADEKVRRVRATLTVDHLRVSWNKATTPYLAFVSKLLRPSLTKFAPVALRIPRPRQSSYKEPANAWLYFDGPLDALRDQNNIVLDIPGGGFVAMGPRMSDDKLLAWASRTGVPILSLDYKKAPEYPYPYALNECYDVYHTIISSRGRCLGLSGRTLPNIVITGDSAGGNLAAGLTLMILQSGSTYSRKWQGEDSLPPPAGLVLIYPSLDMNIGSWMSDEQMSLIRDRGMRKTNRNILRRKSEDYYNKLTPSASAYSHDLGSDHPVLRDYFDQQHKGIVETSDSASEAPDSMEKPAPGNIASQVVSLADGQPKQIQTRLAVSSMISYFNDRILTPEMMRAMIILYIGPHNRPDFSTDFLLSPLLAPEALLARFPKTYFLTGERDPLVDDTVIFAGRIRQAKLHLFRERQELGLEKSKVEFDEKAHVEVTLVPGVSHGFLQFVPVFPEGWKQVFRCGRWIRDLFISAEHASIESRRRTSSTSSGLAKSMPGSDMQTSNGSISRHHRRGLTSESSGDEDKPLEMSMLSMTKSLSPSQSPDLPITQDKEDGASEQQPQPSLEGSVSHPKLHRNLVRTFRPSQPSPRPGNTKTEPVQRVNREAEATEEQGTAHDEDAESAADGDTNDGDDPFSRDWDEKLKLQRQHSLTSLPSEEDILGRRMKGLAGGLMGIGEGARTP